MIKDLVVNLSVAPLRDAAAGFAVSVAAEFQAHVAGIAFQYEQLVPAGLMDGMTPDLIEAQLEESEGAARNSIEAFEQQAKSASVSFESRTISATIGGAADHFARTARRFDLAVIGQAEPDRAVPEEMIVESTLFGAGRPILIVPYIQKAGLKLDRVMVCWDGSRNAARAAADAIPFLVRAKAVDVVMVDGGGIKSEEIPGADISEHFARHGIRANVKRIVEPDVDVANAILSQAADSGADLLVMGGYGHSRLREFILGGATRGILKTMTVPTLMSH